MSHDVFISHAHRDRLVAEAICARLEADGVRCWIAPRDIQPGADWSGSLITSLRASSVLVLVLTNAANSSQHVLREVERAVHLGIAILPIRIEEVLPTGGLEFHLGTVHWLDAMTPPLEAHLTRLSHVVRSVLGQRESLPAEAHRAVPKPDVVSIVRSVVAGLPNPRLYLAANIPKDKLTNAINACAAMALPEEVVLLYDTSLRGNGKTGVLITGERVHWRNTGSDPSSLRFSEITAVVYRTRFLIPRLSLNDTEIFLGPESNNATAAEALAELFRRLAKR
jgi:hypothetical protein